MNRNTIYRITGTDHFSNATALMKKADLASMIEEACPFKGKNARILVKPNLVSPTPARLGATTHPQLVEAVIAYLKDEGFGNIVVAEGSWVGAKTEKSLDVCGYKDILKKYNVDFINTKKDDAVRVDCAGLSLLVCRCALDADFIINIPVLKGHCQTRVTCALKNMKGLIPDSEKRRFHTMGLHEPIAKLSLAVKQDFILVDHICGDPDCEDGGNPVTRNTLFACADPVLTDAYGCFLLGREVGEVPYIGMAKELGTGSCDIQKARIITIDSALEELADASEKPLTADNRIVELSDAVEEVESCSACYGYLIPALRRLDDEGLLEKLDEKICIGQGFKGRTGAIGVGDCTELFTCHIKGCPPVPDDIYKGLKAYILGKA